MDKLARPTVNRESVDNISTAALETSLLVSLYRENRWVDNIRAALLGTILLLQTENAVKVTNVNWVNL